MTMKKVFPFFVWTVRNCFVSSSLMSSKSCPFTATEKGVVSVSSGVSSEMTGSGTASAVSST